MELAGREYVLDYGDFVLQVRYLSASRLAWRQLEGPQAGSEGEQDFSFASVRQGLYFLWWQEEDSSVVSQVLDVEANRVYTTWAAPDKALMAYRGTLRRAG